MPPTGLVHYALAAHSGSTVPTSLMTSSVGVGSPISYTKTHCGALVEAAMPGKWPGVGPRGEHFTPGVRTGHEAAPLLSFLAVLPGGPELPTPCLPRHGEGAAFPGGMSPLEQT